MPLELKNHLLGDARRRAAPRRAATACQLPAIEAKAEVGAETEAQATDTAVRVVQ